ncbi:hypothetical protein DPMN_106542 [Dreissena polymorpha]|uniref:Uncharacterized protein n=1 Tax=Dreissena polymorpha TaxID=45954 RepID=A0A9D4K566_DREPO|nr:hypothetical protein DPMN_106542 [Dreissena polymorpha]
MAAYLMSPRTEIFSTEKQTSKHRVQSFCFELMADEATDTATMEQMAHCHFMTHDFMMQRKHVSGRSSLGLPSSCLPRAKLWLMPSSRTFKLLE